MAKRSKEVKVVEEIKDKKVELNDKDIKKIKLRNIISDINKELKYDVINFASELETKERIPFGIPPLDEFIGGGVQAGNFSVFYGDNGSSKSSLCLNLIANAQKLGKTCVYLDLEGTFSQERAKAFSVNVEEMVYIKVPAYAEQAMNIVIDLAKENLVDLIIIDSIQAFTPLGQFKTGNKESTMEDQTRALLPRVMGTFLNKTLPSISKSKIAVVMIGQVRTDINPNAHGKKVLTGGHALLHSSVLTVFLKEDSGNKADYPTKSYKHYYTDPKTGKDRYETVHEPIGFNTIFRIDKHKVDGCKSKGSEIVLPFYYETGYIKPLEINNDV